MPRPPDESLDPLVLAGPALSRLRRSPQYDPADRYIKLRPFSWADTQVLPIFRRMPFSCFSGQSYSRGFATKKALHSVLSAAAPWPRPQRTSSP